MSVFPITWTDKQDSPELLAYLAQYGSEFYVSATEINKIRDGLNELYNSVGGGTGLINMNGFYPVGQDYIFPAFRVWKINGTVYSNATQISINIPYAAAGKHRIDSIAAMPDDTIIRVPGPEVLISNSAAEASIPPGSIRVTAIPVNESGFGIPEPPILINQFVKKNEFAENIIEDSGDITIGLDTESSSFRITGAVTSIIGFEMSDNFLNDNYYPNKIIKLANNSGSDFPISHVGASTYVARFPSETDFIFKNNHVVFFQPVKTDLGLYLEFAGWSKDTEIDISGKQNISEKNQPNGYAGLDSSGLVPTSLLPSYVDDVIDYANFAALPATGQSGKIYVTTNDNRQYRWSGSTYIAINYKEKFHKVIRQKQMSGGLFSASYINNPVFTDRYVVPDYNYTDIITSTAVFDFKIIFDKKVLVSKFLKVCAQFVSDDIKTCNIHAITNINHVADSAADTVMSNFPIIFNNHDGSDAVFPTSTTADFQYYLNNQDLITYNIQTPVECYGVRIIGKSNMGNTARYAITKFLFS